MSKSSETIAVQPLAPQVLAGSFAMRVVSGRVRILGCDLSADAGWHTVHSPAGGLIAALQTSSAVSRGARVLMRRAEAEASVGGSVHTRTKRPRSEEDVEEDGSEPGLRSSPAVDADSLEARLGIRRLEAPDRPLRLGALVPPSWETTIDALVQVLAPATSAAVSATSPVVVLCGARNVGKSSFARLLLNRALSEGATGVRFLESDLGQPEFTPAGLVSLHNVSEPCLGPPHTHLRTPYACRFVGDASPAEQPAQYVACVAALVAEHRATEDSPPLVVNTCGWVSGLGGMLLADIVAAVSPTHLVYLEAANSTGPPPPPPPAAALDAAPGAQIIRLPGLPPISSLSGMAVAPSPELHAEAEAVEAGGDGGGEGGEGDAGGEGAVDGDANRATWKSPAAPQSQESRSLQLLAYLGALPAGTRRLPGDLLGYAQPRWQSVIGTLLAAPPLAVSLSSLLDVVPRGHSRENLARALNASIVGLIRQRSAAGGAVGAPGWASHDCVGLALVRSVDVASGTLFLSTPVPHDQLTGVKIIARASLDLPLALLQPTALTPASPYLAADALKGGSAGGKQMKSRNNLLRGARRGV